MWKEKGENIEVKFIFQFIIKSAKYSEKVKIVNSKKSLSN